MKNGINTQIKLSNGLTNANLNLMQDAQPKKY